MSVGKALLKTNSGTFPPNEGIWIVIGRETTYNGVPTRTYDNGESWVLGTKPNNDFYDVANIVGKGKNFIAVKNSFIWTSTNAGASWITTHTEAGTIPFGISYGNSIFTNGRIRSLDGGLTWIPCTQPTVAGNVTDLANNNTNKWMLVQQLNGLCAVSTDNADTWTAFTPYLGLGALPAAGGGNSSFIRIAGSGSTWIAAGFYSRVARSTDNGETWTELTRGLNTGVDITLTASGVEVNGTTWIVSFANGYAARSTDDGVTWTTLPQGLNSGSTTDVSTAKFGNNDVWLAFGINGYASKSTDDGETWTALPRGLNYGANTALTINSPN